MELCCGAEISFWISQIFIYCYQNHFIGEGLFENLGKEMVNYQISKYLAVANLKPLYGH